MARPKAVELEGEAPIPILYEDRSVLVIDKPRGWMIVPDAWRDTAWNLQVAIASSISAGAFWARSRNLKFLRYVHRLDAETTGILLFAKSSGGLSTFSGMFEERQIDKSYLAVVRGKVEKSEWTCNAPIGSVLGKPGVMQVDKRAGKEAETQFRLLAHSRPGDPLMSLVEASPVTGRTHQIRVHLAHEGFPVLGDALYCEKGLINSTRSMALRSVRLAYIDPFTRKPIRVAAPWKGFLNEFGFGWVESAGPDELPAFRKFEERAGMRRKPDLPAPEGRPHERK